MQTLYYRQPRLGKLFTLIFLLITTSTFSQTIMFDDFNYSSIDDPQLPVFNKWNIINGRSGPPEGAQYSRNNVAFTNDPANGNNRLMTLSTTVNGATKATTHSRIETGGFEYFEGTYAARVYFSETPFTYKDGNVQTFYTIVSSALGADGSRYSELDFEYLAADKWGISPDNQVMYMTSWNRYIPEPWQAWKRYFADKKSWQGWHTCVVSCTDKVNVKYWIDGIYFGSHSVTDNDGTSVYPRSNMQVAFANWIWNNVTGSSTANRTTTMQVDWTLYYKNQEVLPAAVDNLVAQYRSQGLQRRNLLGQTFYGTACNVPAQPGAITGSTTVTAGTSQTYSIAAVAGATSYTWTLPSGWTGTSTSTSISTTVGSSSGTISVRANNACGAGTTRTLAVTVSTGCTTPAQPGAISGNTSVAAGSAQTYSVAAVSGATSYTWTLPSGWSGSSTTNSISTTAGSVGGTISVRANNSCGAGATRTLTVTVGTASPNLATNKPTTTSSVEAAGLEGSRAVDGSLSTRWASAYSDPQWIYVDLGNTYNINRVKISWEAAYGRDYQVQVSTNASTWTTIRTVTSNTTLVNDWTGLSGSGRYVRIYGTARGTAWGYSVYELEVYGTTGCSAPAQPGTISGNTTVSAGSSQTYSIAAVTGATSYTWTLPSGWSGTSTTTSISTTASSAGGTISVRANNTCGSGATRTLAVTVNGGNTFNTRIEAENYAAMMGIQTESCSEGGLNVGYFDAYDWMSYNITIPTAGSYKVSYRVASTTTGRTLRLEKDNGTTLLGTVTIPNTQGWQNWTTVSHVVTLPAGSYPIGLTTYTGGLNVNWIEISSNLSGTRLDENKPATTSGAFIYPNLVRNKIHFRSTFESNTLIQVMDLSGIEVIRTTLQKGEDMIELRNLAPGNYIIKISNNGNTFIERIIKE